MGIPATSIRGTPGGTRLKDGFAVLIAFSTNLTVEFFELTAQPPGWDGGDEIDITTQHNTVLRQTVPRSLRSQTEMSSTVAYDPKVLDAIEALINVSQAITLNFADSSTWDFFGFLKTFEPQSSEEGSMPEANITIMPTATDPTDDTEVPINYKTSAGTD